MTAWIVGNGMARVSDPAETDDLWSPKPDFVSSPEGEGKAMYRHLRSFTAVLFAFMFLAAEASRAEGVFPGKTWQRVTPESQGVDAVKLQDAVDFMDPLEREVHLADHFPLYSRVERN